MVCDIQPEYKEYFGFNTYSFINFLNEQTEPFIYFYNGYETLGMIREDELKWWLIEHDLDESILNLITFVDKGYGFLRDAIDCYVPDEQTVAMVQEMIYNNAGYYEFDYGTLHTNDCFDVIEQHDNITFVGGSKYACLKELELVAMAYNKTFTFNNDFVY